ncbi:hypothetical protein SLITO_v1c09320 [Spiroplasma litorale]|uniref:Uncharacterized protein n=1 Tax=Spiroplasma litorale TaxID=216942 RepID=A0A0K1W2Y9_9MOLU|nr:hypothetical protein [Spiroplasma litorale]AKX34543.1 hypothetical protein SLITO_v1c09320 [Spiroplasma litorale]
MFIIGLLGSISLIAQPVSTTILNPININVNRSGRIDLGEIYL